MCIRPVPLRRTDLATGQTEVIDLPCGATREAKCPACAQRARRLRQSPDPRRLAPHRRTLPAPEAGNRGTGGLIRLRAHFEYARADAGAPPVGPGRRPRRRHRRGRTGHRRRRAARRHRTATHPDDDQAEDDRPRRKRSTQRRQDAPDLPRRKVDPRTVGRTFTGTRTGTPSYPADPTLPHPRPSTPYGPGPRRRRAPRSTRPPTTTGGRPGTRCTSPALLDRFWQNLRRAEGWNIQYFGCVEPQRRLAPHAHFAIRGTIPRGMLRAGRRRDLPPGVVASTRRRALPRRPAARSGTATPSVGRPGHRRAAADLGRGAGRPRRRPDAEPAHVARFGAAGRRQGVARRHPDAERHDRLHHEVPDQVRRRMPPGHRRPADGRTSTGCGTNCGHAVLDPVRELAAATASSPRTRTAGCGPGHCKGKSPPARHPRHRRPARPRLPRSGRARPSPTTAPTPGPGSERSSASPPTATRATAAGSRGRWPAPATPTSHHSNTDSCGFRPHPTPRPTQRRAGTCGTNQRCGGLLVDHTRRLAGHPSEPLGAASRRTPADPAPTGAGSPRAEHQPLEGVRALSASANCARSSPVAPDEFRQWRSAPTLRGSKTRRQPHERQTSQRRGLDLPAQGRPMDGEYYVQLPTGGRSRRYVYGPHRKRSKTSSSRSASRSRPALRSHRLG